MIDGKDLSSPEIVSQQNGDRQLAEVYSIGGLTKREHMAIEFTKAIVSTGTALRQGTGNDLICKHAIALADELIKQLNSEDK